MAMGIEGQGKRRGQLKRRWLDSVKGALRNVDFTRAIEVTRNL